MEIVKNMNELIKELEEINKDSKGYLEEYLKDDWEAQENFPTIKEYDNCIGMLDELFYVRIYDLALYNLTNNLLKKLKK